MTYGVTSGLVGCQPIANTSTTKQHNLGTIVRAYDPTYGEGEFIYLTGVASTAVGSLVAYDDMTGATVLCPVGNNKPRPIAVAMSANVASQYGWYQISGKAVMKKKCTTSFAAGAAIGVLSIGVAGATGTGKEVQGAIVAAVASSLSAARRTVLVVIDRPHMQGRIT